MKRQDDVPNPDPVVVSEPGAAPSTSESLPLDNCQELHRQCETYNNLECAAEARV